MARANQNGSSDAQQLASLHFSNEMKGLQQYQQQLSSSGNSLYFAQQHQGSLIPPTQGLTPQTQALVNSYIEQKVQAARFENPLQPRMGVMGVLSGQPMLQAPNLQDARMLMAQNQMNVASLSAAPGSQVEPPLPSPNALFSRDGTRRMRGGVIEPFPEKLHRLLHEVEAAGRSDVISFIAEGRAFAIHKPEKFSKEIVPHYFRQSRLSSFKRQLNLYGFELINSGPAKGGYYHKLFIKQQPELCRRMRRVAVKVQAQATTKDSGDDALGPDEPQHFDGSGLGEKGGGESDEGGDGDAGIPKDIFEE